MTDSIDWLVFDLGGVLVDVVPADVTVARVARRSRTPADALAGPLRERFTEQPFSVAERFQLGALDEVGFQTALNNHLRRPLPFDTVIAELEAMLLGVKTDTMALLARLAGHQRIACYSNTNRTHWRYMGRHFDFWRYFERAFASQELGIAKPDTRGFDAVSAALACAPARCLLIDDRQINVDGAITAGWQALRFTSVDQLTRDLVDLGLQGVAAA